MTQPYFHAKNEYYYWRNQAAQYRQKTGEPGLPLVLQRHYERQRLASLRHAATYRALMLEIERANAAH